MDDNLLRHELLHQFTQGLLENNFIPERVGMEINSLVNSIPFSDKIKSEGIRAVKYKFRAIIFNVNEICRE